MDIKLDLREPIKNSPTQPPPPPPRLSPPQKLKVMANENTLGSVNKSRQRGGQGVHTEEVKSTPEVSKDGEKTSVMKPRRAPPPPPKPGSPEHRKDAVASLASVLQAKRKMEVDQTNIQMERDQIMHERDSYKSLLAKQSKEHERRIAELKRQQIPEKDRVEDGAIKRILTRSRSRDLALSDSPVASPRQTVPISSDIIIESGENKMPPQQNNNVNIDISLLLGPNNGPRDIFTSKFARFPVDASLNDYVQYCLNNKLVNDQSEVVRILSANTDLVSGEVNYEAVTEKFRSLAQQDLAPKEIAWNGAATKIQGFLRARDNQVMYQRFENKQSVYNVSSGTARAKKVSFFAANCPGNEPY